MRWLTLGLLACEGAKEHRPRPDAPAPASQPPLDDQPFLPDEDGDGWSALLDCDDDDPGRSPGANELCDGIDNDCDGIADDADGDGFLWCEDCDDLNAEAFFGAPYDTLDGVDQDCDGTDGVGEQPDQEIAGDLADGMGRALAVGDLDGDGQAEVLAGAIDEELVVGDPRIWRIDHGTPPIKTVAIEVPFGGSLGIDVEVVAPSLVAAVDMTFYLDGVAWIHPVVDGHISPDYIARIDTETNNVVVGIEPVGEPPEWWAATRATPAAIGLFPLDIAGAFTFDDATYLVTSDDMHPTTGQSFEAVGDRDGDGLHEVALASSDGQASPGQVYVLTPQLDPVLEESPEIWRGSTEGDDTGWRMDGLHDLDGDGAPDLVIGSPKVDSWRGLLDVVPYLGPGDRLVEAHSRARVEGEQAYDLTEVPAAGDLDGDGQDDLVVGAFGLGGSWMRGKVLWFRGPLQGTLTRADAERVWIGDDPGARFGVSLAIGDIDGSGALDLAIGAPLENGPEGYDDGKVYFVYDPGI